MFNLQLAPVLFPFVFEEFVIFSSMIVPPHVRFFVQMFKIQLCALLFYVFPCNWFYNCWVNKVLLLLLLLLLKSDF